MGLRLAVATTALAVALGGVGFGLAQEGQDTADPGTGGGACATPAAEMGATPEGTPGTADGMMIGATPDASPAAALDECATPQAGTPTS